MKPLPDGAAALDSALADADYVLFLCTGNMVRSAFADLYARHLGCPLEVRSAATVYRNDHLLDETREALVARGVPRALTESFRPRHVQDVLPELGPRTTVFAMARMHLRALEGHPVLARRAFLLGSLWGTPQEILDPVLDGADFGRTFERVARCVETLVQRLSR